MQISLEDGKVENENCDKNARFLWGLSRESSRHPFCTYLRSSPENVSANFFSSQCSRRATRVRRCIKRLSIYKNPFPMLSVAIIIPEKREEIQAFTLGGEVRSC